MSSTLPIDPASLATAEARVRHWSAPTPLEPAGDLLGGPADGGTAPGRSVRDGEGGALYLKREDRGPCRVFKWRGALNALADGEGPAVAASTGNHGLGVAWAGRQLERDVEIFVPEGANPDKLEAIRAQGARLVEAGADLDAAIEAARRRAASGEAELVVDGEHPGIFAGTATIGAEIAVQRPDVERVVVPVGNGALIVGVAAGLQLRDRGPEVVGIAAEGAPFMYESWRRRRPMEAERCDTIADGLAGRVALQPATDGVIRLVDRFELVADDEIRRAIVRFREATGDVIEPSAAAAIAALSSLPHPPGPTVVVISGANISPGLREELFG